MSSAVVNAAVISFAVLAVWALLGLALLIWLRVARVVRDWLQGTEPPTKVTVTTQDRWT